MPVAMTKGGSRYYLAYDQVGSLRVVTDASGNAVKRIEYDAFGNIVNADQQEYNADFKVPFGFAGGLYDADTGLVRFGYRDYDPDTGRWTAKDPILFAGGDTDLYGYCLNDPVNGIDPEGMETTPCSSNEFQSVIPGDNRIVYDKNGDIYELVDGNYVKVEITLSEIPIGPVGKLKDITRIATSKNIRKVKKLVEKWGGKKKDWRKMKGIDDQGKEWHWYQKRGDGTKYGTKPAGKPDPF